MELPSLGANAIWSRASQVDERPAPPGRANFAECHSSTGNPNLAAQNEAGWTLAKVQGLFRSACSDPDPLDESPLPVFDLARLRRESSEQRSPCGPKTLGPGWRHWPGLQRPHTKYRRPHAQARVVVLPCLREVQGY